MKPYRRVAKEFEYFVLSFRGGKGWLLGTRNHKTPRMSNHEMSCPKEGCHMINKTIFEENWKLIRDRSTERWSLMADFDLYKVDKAEVKFDKFVTMLQVKYGFTRQQARDEINKFWAEYNAGNKK
jgi:hypothetical protein